MTGFVGTDPALLHALRAAIVRSTAELDHWRNTDPEAADAMRVVARSLEVLERRWLPVVDRALGLDHRSVMRDIEAIAADRGPLAAAPLVAAAHLSDDELAELCDALLRTWWTGRADGSLWDDQLELGPNAADALFALLASRPAAATAFLMRAAAHPELVFLTAEDEQVVRRLLLTATSRDQVGVVAAGAIIVPLLDWVRHNDGWDGSGHDGATPHAQAFMAEVIAPWLVHFGRRSGEWGWTHAEADASLRWVVTDEGAMAALIASLGAHQGLLASSTFVAADGAVDLDALLDVATVLAQLELAFRAADIDAHAMRRLWLDIGLELASTIASLAGELVGIPDTATDAATSGLSWGTRRALDQWGVVETVETATTHAQARFGTRSADTAVIAVIATVGRLVDAGRLPADSLARLDLDGLDDADEDNVVDATGDCRAAAVVDRLQGYVGDLGRDADPATANALATVMLAFANPASTIEAC